MSYSENHSLSKGPVMQLFIILVAAIVTASYIIKMMTSGK